MGLFAVQVSVAKNDVPMYCTCRAFLVLSTGPAVRLGVGERLPFPLLKKLLIYKICPEGNAITTVD